MLNNSQRLLQAELSDLSRDLQADSDDCAELERSLDQSRPRLLETERDLAKIKRKRAEALKEIAHRRASSDQLPLYDARMWHQKKIVRRKRQTCVV